MHWRLKISEIQPWTNTFVIPKAAYGALAAPPSRQDLSTADKDLTQAILRTTGLAPTTNPGIFFAPRSAGGPQLSKISTKVIEELAGELYIILNKDNVVGNMYRKMWDMMAIAGEDIPSSFTTAI